MHNKTFIIAKYPKYDRYQRGIAPMVYKFFFSKKKEITSDEAIKNENMSNKELAEKLEKPVINKIQGKKYTNLLIFSRQCLGHKSRRYAIGK